MSQDDNSEKGLGRHVSIHRLSRLQGWWRREDTDCEERGTECEDTAGDNLEQAVSKCATSHAPCKGAVAFGWATGCCPCLLHDALLPETFGTRPSGMCYPQGLLHGSSLSGALAAREACPWFVCRHGEGVHGLAGKDPAGSPGRVRAEPLFPLLPV